MKIVRGTSIRNPIVIKQIDMDLRKVSIVITENEEDKNQLFASLDTIQSILDALFSPIDGDYFIKQQADMVIAKKNYKIFHIEDRDEEKHSVFFQIIK